MLTKENISSLYGRSSGQAISYCSYCCRASFGDLSSPLQANKIVLHLSNSSSIHRLVLTRKVLSKSLKILLFFCLIYCFIHPLYTIFEPVNA